MSVQADRTDQESNLFLDFWGKARPMLGAPACYHPVAYHSLDVAACAQVVLECNHLLRERLATALGLTPEQTTLFLVAQIALHDLGKFSKPFQAICPEHWPEELGDIAEAPAAPRHDAAGFLLWRHDSDNLRLTPVARAVFGHHGSPTEEDAPLSVRALYGKAGLAAARTFKRNVLALLMPEPITPSVGTRQLNVASYGIAGLVVLADWIGSSQRAFPYVEPTLGLAEYWHSRALPQAARAVGRAGVTPVPSAPVHTSYGSLTGVSGYTPSAMQQWAAECELAQGPGIYIVEDATGSGKTECALMLAHRMIAAGLGSGLYIALPTMATADGMYDRMAFAYRNLFATDGTPSLALAHGARDLHEGWTTSILDMGADNEPTSAECRAWIADDRRKTFLAQVGVGTVDQAILSVLPSRHQSLRLVGLLQRVLILDEVHAYDAYMSQEIVRLLEFHVALGGSAIVLSATLPAEIKQRLGVTATPDEAYPLATVQSATGCTQTPCAPFAPTCRTVPISFLSEPAKGLDLAKQAAANAQAVLYIRNSVDDAIETYRRIDPETNPILFHARFAMCDRLTHQAKVLRIVGKDSTPDIRAGQLVVATQVVEQSLDIDFDLIITDLAPIDLIIQRAGRLHRHRRQRPEGTRCEIVVVGPEPDPEPTEGWLRSSLPRTSYVYCDHARMWLSAQALHNSGVIDAPDGLRPMIEHVYGRDIHERVPEGLRRSLRKIVAVHGGERGQAIQNTLRLGDGYARLGPWLSDERIPTRLGKPTTTLRLGFVHNGAIIPWASRSMPDADLTKQWALSEVSVAAHKVSSPSNKPNYQPLIERAQRAWAPWDVERVPLIVLEPEGTDWRGTAVHDEKTVNLFYSTTTGLRWK